MSDANAKVADTGATPLAGQADIYKALPETCGSVFGVPSSVAYITRGEVLSGDGGRQRCELVAGHEGLHYARAPFTACGLSWLSHKRWNDACCEPGKGVAQWSETPVPVGEA